MLKFFLSLAVCATLTPAAFAWQNHYLFNKAALEVLRNQKKLTHRYWHDATVQMTDFKSDGVVASSSWGYMVNALVAEKQPIASTIPEEGSTGWADTTMLHAEAKNVNCAYKWMEWSLGPKVQIALSEWFGSVR